MAFWLVKSEISKYSIDDLRKDRVTYWSGVRNYQARNFLKSMQVGELVLFYHSVDAPIGVVGIARVAALAKPDPTQFDSRSEYFDEDSPKDNPRWWCPDLEFVEKFPGTLETKAIRELPGLEGMELLKPHSRLSVQPVSEKQFTIICAAARDSGGKERS